MRQIQEILRLKHQNQLSIREIARSCGLPTSTIGDYLKRAAAAGIVWPLAEGQSEKELLQLLLAQPAAEPAAVALPDWPYIHQELRRKRVTLFLLWQEYSKGQPEGYCYSRFCQLYRRWAGTLEPVLRQVHLPGEKMFVDWAGQKVEIHNAQDGSVSEGHLFVAVLGASNKTYAEAFENEQLAAWIEAHCHAYNFFQGVARITVPDYVARHIIGLLFPTAICALLGRKRPVSEEDTSIQGHIIFLLQPPALPFPLLWKGNCHVRKILSKAPNN